MLALALASAACTRKPEAGAHGQGVLVIAIDALRADHLSCAGYDRETTPELDALAREGVRFPLTFSAAPCFVPAHAALLTGCDAELSRRILPEGMPATIHTEWHVPDEAPRLAREFAREGYATAAFSDQTLFSPAYGFASGFQTFVSAVELTEETTTKEVGIAGISAHLEQWLRNQRGRKWFAYVELADLVRVWGLQEPAWDTYFQQRPGLSAVPPVGEGNQVFFAIPRANWSLGLHTLGEYEAKYDGALRRVDQALGRLFANLQKIDAWKETTVVVVGSYGLGFGENGLILDSGTLSDVDLRVPWILRPAQSLGIPGGRAIPALASLTDLAPTLLELHGLEVDPAMHGISLAGAIRGEEPPAREFVFANCGVQEGWVAIDERWCFESIWPGRVRDFTLAESWYGDPLSHRDELRETLHDRHSGTLGHLGGGEPDPELAGPRRAAGLEWKARIERRRQQLQAERWRLGTDEGQTDSVPAAPDGGGR